MMMSGLKTSCSGNSSRIITRKSEYETSRHDGYKTLPQSRRHLPAVMISYRSHPAHFTSSNIRLLNRFGDQILYLDSFKEGS
jgi:hypothetical protein